MQATKITTTTGAFTILVPREAEAQFACKINHVSSTELQPTIAVNHDASGKAIAGMTMTDSMVAGLIKKCGAAGLAIEQITI